MKRHLKTITALISIAIFMCIFTLPVFAVEDDTPSKEPKVLYNAENYETRSFNVDISIDENNVYQVKESITVEYIRPSHGIFRYMPTRSSIVREVDGNPAFFPTRASYSNVKVKGYNLSTETDNGNLVLKIGDENTLVDGTHTYEISYKYRPHDDRSTEYDEVYFNILPGNCPTPIEAASFNITMPKAFDKTKVWFYCGEYGEQGQDMISFDINGNTISGKLNEAIPRKNGATLRVELPNGYFSNQRTDTLLIALLWVLLIISPVIVILLWLAFGRDEKLVKPITVMPPKGMTSADIGYIIDETVEVRDIMSLLFYWGDKGYIAINESDDKNSGFILTKLLPLPEYANEYEHVVFERLFRGGEISVSTKALSGKFNQSIAMAQVMVANKYKSEHSARIYTKTSKKCEFIACLLGFIPLAAVSIIASWVNVCDISSAVVMLILSVLISICGLCFVSNIKHWHGQKDSTRVALLTVNVALFFALSLIAVAVFGISLSATASFTNSFYINPLPVTIIAVIGTIICVFFASVMRKRTAQMQIWYGEILGLKEFIETAEKERLEMMVAESPAYFFNILPYAYVLGVSDKWAKQFENIAVEPPSWYGNSTGGYSGFNTFMFMSAINHQMQAAQTQLSTPPAPTGSSSSGGFSGGGGGGFSGGGGGGGGMGSW